MQPRVGVVLYAALATIVPVTVYSVAVDRVMDLQLLVRITLQYALARYAVWAVGLGPLFYVGFDIHANQQLTIAEYIERFSTRRTSSRYPRWVWSPLCHFGNIPGPGRRSLVSSRAIRRVTRTLARLEQRYRMADSLRGVTGGARRGAAAGAARHIGGGPAR